VKREAGVPELSVVVPAFNGARFLDETLDSVLAQRGVELELIVVDDGSTDGTRELLARRGARLRWEAQANQGVAAARNRGAALARGAHLAFLDQDDLWEPDCARTLLDALAARPGCSLVYADSWVIDARGRMHGRRGRFLRCASGEVFAALLRRNFVPVETTLFARAGFEALGGYDPTLRYLEDWELCLRAARRGPFAFVDRPLARYRVHARNLSHAFEPLLLEGFTLLERVEARCAPLSAREREQLALERRRLALDLAWKALRRNDRAAARDWRARAARTAGSGPAWALTGARLRVAGLDLALALLPERLGAALLARLPAQRLYGLRASDLEPERCP